MTYVLTLKENSFNNRFSTHRVSLGMVYNQLSCCILTEDVTTREGTRENNKNDVKSTILSQGRQPRSQVLSVGQERTRGCWGAWLYSQILTKKSDGLWNENAKENLCPCAVRKQAPRQPAGSIFPSVRPLKLMRRSTDVFILRLGRIKFTSYIPESSIIVTSEALN